MTILAAVFCAIAVLMGAKIVVQRMRTNRAYDEMRRLYGQNWGPQS